MTRFAVRDFGGEETLYIREVSELAEAVGLMAHTEFEFLSRKVQAARQSLVQTRDRLMEHTAQHGC